MSFIHGKRDHDHDLSSKNHYKSWNSYVHSSTVFALKKKIKKINFEWNINSINIFVPLIFSSWSIKNSVRFKNELYFHAWNKYIWMLNRENKGTIWYTVHGIPFVYTDHTVWPRKICLDIDNWPHHLSSVYLV